ADLWGEYARAASPLEDPDECIDGDDAVMRNNNDGRLIIDHSLGKFPVIVNEVYTVLKRENIPNFKIVTRPWKSYDTYIRVDHAKQDGD
ncbi:unnamed protein product, partial [Didymodactylos carnosus]